MDAGFYSILPSKVKISLLCLNGQPTIGDTHTGKNMPPMVRLLFTLIVALLRHNVPLVETYSTVQMLVFGDIDTKVLRMYVPK